MATIDAPSSMLWQLRPVGDPVLTSPAAPVRNIDGALASVVGALWETCAAHGALGVAAPQIGVALRLFVFDVDGHTGTIINPQVVTASRRSWTMEEGCLSVPGETFEVARPRQVTVCGFDLDGGAVVIEDDGLLGRVLLHEIDHLDGTLILHRAGGRSGTSPS